MAAPDWRRLCHASPSLACGAAADWGLVADGIGTRIGADAMSRAPSTRQNATMGGRSSVLLPLAVVADRLCYTGSDRERSVRRLFLRHGVPFIRRGRGAFFVTELQYASTLSTRCIIGQQQK